MQKGHTCTHIHSHEYTHAYTQHHCMERSKDIWVIKFNRPGGKHEYTCGLEASHGHTWHTSSKLQGIKHSKDVNSSGHERLCDLFHFLSPWEQRQSTSPDLLHLTPSLGSVKQFYILSPHLSISCDLREAVTGDTGLTKSHTANLKNDFQVISHPRWILWL